jgi:hypothetical protein
LLPLVRIAAGQHDKEQQREKMDQSAQSPRAFLIARRRLVERWARRP